MSPRTKKQIEEIREDKRQLIMNTALSLFAGSGYGNTSMNEIAKKAKISKGLIYNYFESKEALIQTILNKGIDKMLAIFDPNKDGKLEVHELEFFITESIKTLKENRPFWKLYFQISMQPDVFALVEEKINTLYEPIMSMMVNYFAETGFENPEMEAMLFGTLMDGISLDYVMAPQLYPIDKIKDEIIRRYCCPRRELNKNQ